MNRRVSLFLLLLPALLIIVLALLVPVGYLISFSFFTQGPMPGMTGEFTFGNYLRLLDDLFYQQILLKTLWVSLLATGIAVAVGYSLAYFMWRMNPRWRGLFTIIVLSPLLVSIVVNSYGWVVLLGTNGLINQVLLALGIIGEPLALMHNDGAIVVGLVHVSIPFMTLSILAALEKIDPLIGEAAATLGATRARIVRHVYFPLSLPGIAAGSVIVFCLCVSAYVTPAVLGGSGPNFITTLIYNQIVLLFDWPFGATLSALLLTTSLLIVLAYVAVMSRLGAMGTEREGNR